MPDLETQINQWRSQMLATGIQSPVPLDELETHLRDEIQNLVRSGASEDKAFQLAAHSLGNAPVLRAEFSKIPRKRFRVLRENPAALNLLAIWFVIAGINALCCLHGWFWVGLSRATVPGLCLNLMFVAQVLLGIGLAFRSSYCRYAGIVWSGFLLLSYLGSIVWTVFITHSGLGKTTSLAVSLVGGSSDAIRYYFLDVPLPLPFLHIVSLINVSLLLLGLHLLTRSSARQLFRRDARTKTA